MLAQAERLLKRRTSYLDHRLGRLLGPQLGALLNDDAMRRLSGTYQAPYISVHVRAYLEHDGDSDGPDRVSMARYHEAVSRQQLLSRTQTAEEEACPILATFIASVNGPLKAYLHTIQRDRGGAPGRVFRKVAIHQLAVIYEKIFGKPATPTVGGPFLNFCRVVLEAIGIETDGLRGAVARELKKLKS